MDNLIWILIPIAIILAISIWLRSPKGIGTVGEWRVRLALGRNKEHERYIINNLIVTGENGRTSQIDHVLINSNGIFVIETKNYAGRIYGQSNQREWTQVLAGGRVKYKMYNPIKQNTTHLYKVKSILGDDLPVFSIIVFVRGNINYINANCVYDIKGMKEYFSTPSKKQLTTEQMVNAYNILCETKENCYISDKEHIANIDKLQEDIANNICPRCGAELVERNGRNGKFWGCSKFPKCKFTK